ncbi:MAG: sugar transferase [Planctomycetaceae bacterium]|nr:sugar transferase [Planctomycetaceae bacterium]
MAAVLDTQISLDALAQRPAATLPFTYSSYDFAKRIMDIVVGSLLLALMAPLMLVTALLVKLTSRGPVIFRQERAGLGEQPFTMFKFRTMRVGAEDDRTFLNHRNEKDGPVFKITNDPRLTSLGRLLRRSSIDELPQLFNVLAGHMSLVGPRPLWMPEAKKVTGPERIRLAVKPGLTCLWQISGRSDLTFAQWMSLDQYYVAHRCLLLDAMIMIQTLPVILSGQGAY